MQQIKTLEQMRPWCKDNPPQLNTQIRNIGDRTEASGRRSCSINNQTFLSIKVPPPSSLLTTAASLSSHRTSRRLKSSANSSISAGLSWSQPRPLVQEHVPPPGTLQQKQLTHSSVQLRSSAPAAAAAAGIRSSAAGSSWLPGR